MLTDSVLIIGAGPTGLTLGCELARRGIAFRLIDASPGPAVGSRAKGIQPRTLEVLDDLGVVDQAIAGGRFRLRIMSYAGSSARQVIDTHEDYRPRPDAPYGSPLIIPQWRTESILRERLAALGGPRIEHGTRLSGLSQDEDGVTAVLERGTDTETVRAAWLVGCDGAHSRTRNLLGLAFNGETNEAHRMLIGDVRATGLDREYWHVFTAEGGVLALAPLPCTDVYQLQASIGLEDPSEPSLEWLQRIVDERTGRDDIRLLAPEWMSTWRANVRMVDRYRLGRVLLAGDAAHVHSPAGGQGMNTGIQDAYNLGWKLAAVQEGADTALLDTYEEERLPIAAWVLGLTGQLHRQGLAQLEQRGLPATRNTESFQLGLNYRGCTLARELRANPVGLRAGDRAPDAPGVRSAHTEHRLFDLLRGTHFTLLAFGDNWEGPILEVQARFGASVRPVLFSASPSARVGVFDTEGHAAKAYGVCGATLFLIRPDGHVGLAMDEPAVEPLLKYLSEVLPHQ
jgi:2-polyprenyl-6-methoxyphenol hydroxylase-like FAD-dependent oxidoreductase